MNVPEITVTQERLNRPYKCPLSGFAGLQDFTEPFSAYGGCAHPRREALALHSAAEHSEKREQRVTSQIIAVRTGRTIFDEMTAHQ